MGCNNACVFCNQRKISGVEKFDISSVSSLLEKEFSTVDYANDEVEIAFFGGSFTGIPREDMIYLLGLAYGYVEKGMAKSIRLSTRPDYIDDEILEILEKYKVTDIELGLQSMDDEVLAASKRGHTAEQGEIACRKIKDKGFSLVGQMMIGLPESTGEKEIMTARKLAELGCDGVRIYPTVVFAETALCEMMKSGEYTPLETDEAVKRSSDVLEIFVNAHIPVLRLGLCAADNLFTEGVVLGGGYHSAMGELVYSELYFRRIRNFILSRFGEGLKGKNINIVVGKNEISKAVGQKRCNAKKLLAEFGIKNIKFTESDRLSSYSVDIKINDIGKGE